MSGVFTRIVKRWWRHKERRTSFADRGTQQEGYMAGEAESVGTQLEAKECQGLAAITRTPGRKEHFFLEPSEGARPYSHLDF